MEDCIFCKIAKGTSPCYKIYEDDYTLAFLDISKDCYGHTLVIPKSHYKNTLDCNEEIFARVMLTVQKVSKHYVNELGFKGINILNANNKEAGQSVNHLHFHILPKKEESDFNSWPKLNGTMVPFETQLEQLQIKN